MKLSKDNLPKGPGQSVTVQVPGKLYIAGEYAVTKPGQLAIIAPVPRYLQVTISASSSQTTVQSSLLPGRVATLVRRGRTLGPTKGEEDLFPLVGQTIRLVDTFIQQVGIQPAPFALTIQSDLDDQASGHKYGLGSSGAVTVATVEALLDWYGVKKEPLLVYQLAALVHVLNGSKGSFGDLAVSAFKAPIAYALFNKDWVRHALMTMPLVALVRMNWPLLRIEPLAFPRGTGFLVGWTGRPASTEALVADITTARGQESYQRFLSESQSCVLALLTAWRAGDFAGMAGALGTNRCLLRGLSAKIETEKLATLCQDAQDLGLVAKSSGAGGGDCGIALVHEASPLEDLVKAWSDHAIQTLFMLGDVSWKE